ncbi:hypothetical protein Dimus_003404 [Dionaea muscipula]
MRAELDDMRQRPVGPPTPTTTDDVVKEFDDVQYITGFSDRWLGKHTAGDIVIINYPTDLFGEVVIGMISYEEAMYVCNRDESAHTTMNLFMCYVKQRLEVDGHQVALRQIRFEGSVSISEDLQYEKD